MADYSNIKKGTVLRIDGELYLVTWFLHVKPGKGGAFVRTKLKNLMRNTVVEKTFRSSDKIEEVQIEHRRATFLYQDGNEYVFMDTESFEQEHVHEDILGEDAKWLTENMEVDVDIFEGKIIFINLPYFVELEIAETEPGMKGDTVTNVTKPATLQTGAQIQVPLFVEQGETVKIDTRTGEYIERVSKK